MIKSITKVLTVLALILSFSATKAQNLEYPFCPKHTVADTFFNKYIVTENYRWLENVRSDSAVKWIEAENKLSRKFLSKASAKYNCKSLLDKFSYVRSKKAVKKGKYFYRKVIRNSMASASLYIGEKYNEVDQILIDPNYNNKGDKVSITSYHPSKDSKLLAYTINRNGTDWREIKVVSLPSGKKLSDHIKGVKFSSTEWKGDGFYYKKYPNKGEFYSSIGEEIYYHKLGDPQDKDKLIFKRKDPSVHFGFMTSSNERFFFLYEETKTHCNYFFIDFNSDQPYLRPLLMKQKNFIHILDSQNGKIIAKITKGSNGGSIVEIDPYNPYQWREIVPAIKNGVLLRCIPKADRLITIFQRNQTPLLKIFKYSGEQLYSLELPQSSSVNGFYGEKGEEDITFTLQELTKPAITFHFNTRTFERKYGDPVNVTFAFKNYETKSINYTVNDSIKVPLTLVYKKGLKLDGNNPCMLCAYGGFGRIFKPKFDPGIVYFIEKGGVFAYANVRGGGDLGKKWTLAGRRLNKQNAIDDFNAAAEFLIKEKYTSSEKLAAKGSSHGGLLVAAAAIQRPDLYKAVVPVVGVMDMLRFENFTVGNFHTDEFGSVQNSLDFVNLKSYSPLHNIKEDVNYPSMLVMTSENDDRVPPFHSYKFVARLQNRKAQTNPILLRVEQDAGHNGAMNKNGHLRKKADMYGFILKILNQ
ncbi:prolyl oligopeptidase family serine peptidase [Marinifilum flexuosum]|uniref:prolyl oligopeptidase family serine peptidase n=1 Tax=Marinifilum flexuosum TaxID=1117708 RepID=UPI002495A11E|nr:prolyl oligopeptidase family serine peptidase [Marinifilum flexuosum]